jgi:hypothetical protein
VCDEIVDGFQKWIHTQELMEDTISADDIAKYLTKLSDYFEYFPLQPTYLLTTSPEDEGAVNKLAATISAIRSETA